jgi:hypothetical protein
MYVLTAQFNHTNTLLINIDYNDIKNMPKFYCEYCGIYLTHSSPSGRRQHASGKRHKQYKVDYYRNIKIMME